MEEIILGGTKILLIQIFLNSAYIWDIQIQVPLYISFKWNMFKTTVNFILFY